MLSEDHMQDDKYLTLFWAHFHQRWKMDIYSHIYKNKFAHIIEEMECNNIYEEVVYMKEIQFYTRLILRKKTCFKQEVCRHLMSLQVGSAQTFIVALSHKYLFKRAHILYFLGGEIAYSNMDIILILPNLSLLHEFKIQLNIIKIHCKFNDK